jgi:hypothetical protein
VNITNQPQSLTVSSYANASFTVGAWTDSTVAIGPENDWRNSFNTFFYYQWYKNGVAVPGATSSAYTLSPVLPSDAGSQVMCSLRSLGLVNASGADVWTNTQTVSITVVTNVPQLAYAAAYTNSNYTNFNWAATNYITLGFTTPIDPGLMSQMSSYTLPAGWTLLGVMVNSNDYRSVALAYTGGGTLPITVKISPSLVGLGGGLPVSNTSISVDPVELTDTDIGSPSMDPSVPGMMYVTGANAYAIQCEGSDIWNAADGFNFAYELKTNDFDVVVRVTHTTHVSNWTKAGLMIRETLDPSSRDWNIVNDPVSSDNIMAADGTGFGANAVEANARTTYDGTSASWATISTLPVPAYPNAWVRVKRVGTVLSAYSSTNGYTWLLEAQQDPGTNGQATPLTNVVYVGICTTAHDNDAQGASPLLYLETADYDNYGAPQVAPVTTTLAVAKAASGSITVSWTPAGGTLMSSPALSGASVDWTAVGTANPATIPITGKAQYFRVVNQ